MVNRLHPMQLVATPAKLTVRAALHLEACSNAVALAIIANPIALDSVLKSDMHRKSALQLPTMMMLGKEQLSGL